MAKTPSIPPPRKQPEQTQPEQAQPEQTLTQKARLYADAALQTLVDVAIDHDAPPAARLQAANALLDRGYGKTPGTTTEDHEALPREIRIIAVNAASPAHADDDT